MENKVKKAIGVLEQVWRIGKRRFGGDWERRMKLFDWLMESVLAFGTEVWGWRKWGKVEGYKKNT